MLRNIFLKTFRDYRRQILIWGGGLAMLMFVYGFAYNSVFGPSPDRAKIIEDYKKAFDSFSLLTGKVYDLDTFGGFIMAKIGSAIPILLGIWGLLAGSALIRGEEEKGSLDVLLTTPHTRASVLLQKWAGITVSLLLIVGLSWVGLVAGAAGAKVELDPVAGIMAHINWALGVLMVAGIALVFSQFTTRRAAASWAGGIMVSSFLLNNLVENVPSLQWTHYINPYYYASLSQPLARSVGTNWGGLAVLVVLVVVLVALGLWMYQQRDHNGYFQFGFLQNKKPAVSRSNRTIAEPKSVWLTNNFLFGLRTALPGILVWSLSLSAYILLILSVFDDVKTSMVDLLKSVSFFQQLGFGNLTRNENILSLFLFIFMVLLVAAYAIIQVASWTSEENEGRLELVLSTPQPRWRLLLTNFGVAIVASGLLLLFIGLFFGLCTIIFNISVDFGNSVAAFFGLWIVSIIIEAIGFVLAAFGPGWAVAVTTGLVIASYLTDILNETLKLPEALTNLSVFKQYGQPLMEGIHWPPQIVMVAVSVVLVAIAVYWFRRRDIVK